MARGSGSAEVISCAVIKGQMPNSTAASRASWAFSSSLDWSKESKSLRRERKWNDLRLFFCFFYCLRNQDQLNSSYLISYYAVFVYNRKWCYALVVESIKISCPIIE